MKYFSIRRIWKYLQASYWFIPTLMVVAALILSIITSRVDVWLGDDWLRDINVLFDNRAIGARTVLSTIAGSMITVAGVTFSMTVVSVSFAAAQFGPRLVGNFMRDTGNQVTLGVFIATFVYCLMILRTVRSADDSSAGTLAVFVPHVSILLALALALGCVAVLIYFIHHIPETINIANITAAVGRQLVRNVEERCPLLDGGRRIPPAGAELPTGGGAAEASEKIECQCHGYLQFVDLENLIELATDHDARVVLICQPGDFVSSGDRLLEYFSEQPADDELKAAIRSSFHFGRNRTPDQDPLFLVDELVEIMVRALSPGLNDPFTAIGCINWLRSALSEMIIRDDPQSCFRDDSGTARVIAKVVGFEHFASAIFEQSTQYVSTDRNATMRMMDIIREITLRTDDDNRQNIVRKHAENLLIAAEERLPTEIDRGDVRRQYDNFVALTA